MKRVDLLIKQIRRATENEEFSDSIGITDDEILQYLNDAQTRLQSKIADSNTSIFIVDYITDTVKGQEAYDLPENTLLGNMVKSVEHAQSGANDEDFYKLEYVTLYERNTNVDGIPSWYSRRNGQVLLSPLPQNSTGRIRIQYVRKLAELDKRRGIVSSVTLNTTDRTITELKLDPAGTPPIDSDSLGDRDYMTIVDRYGNVKMKNIPFDSIDTATGVVTITSGFTYDEGETIAVGNYCAGGTESTTHSELPDICERYLLAYAQTKLLARDSSVDVAEQLTELTSMERDLMKIFADPEDDVVRVPRLDDPWNG